MKTVTRMLQDELFESSNENGNKVLIDMRKNEARVSQSPTELLLSAVAGCSAVDLVLMLKKRRKQVDELTIETDGTRREETPRYFTAIHCTFNITSPDVTQEEATKSAQLSLEKYCSVASSLKAIITFSVVIKRPV